VKGKKEAQTGSNPGAELRLVEFKDNKAQNLEEFEKIFNDNLELMKEAVVIWTEEDDEVYYCATGMKVATLAGLLEMAKIYAIGAVINEE
jgi:hypothetical protein